MEPDCQESLNPTVEVFYYKSLNLWTRRSCAFIMSFTTVFDVPTEVISLCVSLCGAEAQSSVLAPTIRQKKKKRYDCPQTVHSVCVWTALRLYNNCCSDINTSQRMVCFLCLVTKRRDICIQETSRADRESTVSQSLESLSERKEFEKNEHQVHLKAECKALNHITQKCTEKKNSLLTAVL